MKNLLRLTLLICTPALLPMVHGPLAAQPAADPAAPPQPHPDVAALLKQADAAQEARKFDEALPLFDQALARARAAKDKPSEAYALASIGAVHRSIGQPQQALRFHEQALPLLRATGNKAGEARTLNNIGSLYRETGQPQQALSFFEQALPLLRQVGDKRGEARTLGSIGVVYQNTGQPQQALRFYEQALPLSRQVGDKAGEASTLNSMGGVYYVIGQSQQAVKFFEQVLLLNRQTGDKEGEVTTLNNIAAIYRSMGQPQQALRFYEQVLPLRRQGGDKIGESITLTSIGEVYHNIGEPQQALRFYEQALPLNRQTGDKEGEAFTLTRIAAVYRSIGQMQQALRFYEQVLPLLRQVGDKEGEANTLTSIGAVYGGMGQLQQALRFHEQALPLRRQVGDKAGVAATLTNIGLVYRRIGQPQQALRFYEQALPLRRQGSDKFGEARTLDHIGTVYASTGQPQQALRFYEQALSLRRQVGDKAGEETTLNNIGLVYRDIGQPQQALRFYEQALPLRRQGGDKAGGANTLNNIGGVYLSMGQPQQALRFLEQVLPLRRQVGDKAGEANTLHNIGVVYLSIGQPQRALRFFEQALPLIRRVGGKVGEARTLDNIGEVYLSMGQPQQALRFFEQALPMLRAAGDKVGEARTLDNIAKVEEAQGRLTQADKHLRAALIIHEGMRESLSGSHSKVSFLESKLYAYHRYINLLLKQKSPASAFEWTQKTKARALLDLMQSGRVDISKGASPGEQERERELKWQVGQANQKLIAEATRPKPDKKQVAALKAQLAQAESALQSFTDSLYAKYPDLARKRAARTATLADVARFLPPDTALLEYVVLNTGDLDKTVVFCVTAQNGKATVAAYPITVTRQQLAKLAEEFRAACADPKKDYRGQARRLYNLLVAPGARHLAGKKRLIVCPDGPLWGLPFQALLTPSSKTSGGKNGDAPFLIQQYEINYAYSATGAQAALLAGRNLNTKPKQGQPAGTLLAMANPNFGGAGRFDSTAASPTASSGGTQDKRPLTINLRPLILNLRSAGNGVVRNDGSIAPLPGTQWEASAIRADFPSALIHTGMQAQEATAKRQAGQFRYLHFATHSVFNDAAPMMSSIVLADPGAASPEDGLLTAREIFDLNWPAELVVLSACNTARGEQRSGEGIVGLTWALFVAGAPTQVLSQWAVADASTAQLMKSFYANLKTGRAKGEALRGASLSLMKDGKHAHPFYWAPFVLIGDWR